MQTLPLKARLLLTLAGAALIAAAPIHLGIDDAGWVLEPAKAFAKDGDDDDDGGDDSGGDDDDDGGDDSGGDDDGSDDDDDDDDSGSGSGGSGGDDDDDDDEDDDDDQSGGDDGAGANGAPKIEISRNGIEVVNADGTKEEIENGRYERKDRFGRTVEERPATQADIDRLRGLAGTSGAAATRLVSSGTAARVEIGANSIEVVYSDGTKEEIENGRYQRKDASGRTVEERPATQADVDRLRVAAGTARPVRRIEVGSVARIERSAAGIEVIYATGWKEELEGGRYELKDPNNNTVVERPATDADRARLRNIAGS